MLGINYTKKEKDWVLYDVGNSALFMLITAFVPMYFNSLLKGNTGDEIVVIWANAQTITSLVVAVLMPILGSFADYPNKKIKLFNLFFLIGLIGCFILSVPMGPTPFIIIYVLMCIGLNASLTFYDAMLVDVTDENRMDQVSSSGYAWGYIGSVVPFVISLVIYSFPQMFGLSKNIGERLPFIITGIWWLVFTLPLIRNYRQIHFKPVEEISVASTFKGLGKTMKAIKADRRIFLYVMAYFFYIDGVHTVISMSATYGISLHIPEEQMLIAFLVTQFVAFPSAIAYGRLAKKFGTLKMIRVAVAAYGGLVIFAAFFLRTSFEFYVLAIVVGLFQGGVQALSRSYFGKIIPKQRSNEYYGFFDIFGRAASIMGTLVVSAVTFLTSDPDYGVLSIGLLLIAGYLLLIQVQKEDNKLAAEKQTAEQV